MEIKTLQQVESRTGISSLPFTITNGGSYYLTTNLVGGVGGGIIISASRVTLDLMGFEMVGGAAGSGGKVFPVAQSNRSVHWRFARRHHLDQRGDASISDTRERQGGRAGPLDGCGPWFDFSCSREHDHTQVR